eukprot:gene24970-33469_t
MEDLNFLVKTTGNHIARTVVESNIVYPKTSSIDNQRAIFSSVFDAATLSDVIRFIEADIGLKAIDAVKDSVVLLKLLNEFKESILLSQADYLLIYKAGFDIIKLENSAKLNSGRSMYIDINSCRNELVRYVQTMRRQQEFPWLQLKRWSLPPMSNSFINDIFGRLSLEASGLYDHAGARIGEGVVGVRGGVMGKRSLQYLTHLASFIRGPKLTTPAQRAAHRDLVSHLWSTVATSLLRRLKEDEGASVWMSTSGMDRTPKNYNYLPYKNEGRELPLEKESRCASYPLCGVVIHLLCNIIT